VSEEKMKGKSCFRKFSTHKVADCFFLEVGSALLPKLESSDAITAHCGLKLGGSSNPPTSACRVAGTTDVHHLALLDDAFL
uniref:Uncharacterized protein n=1 Tax=Prolemur simus TaxID=1328070 RepID=A0A8C8YX64_PROSS